MFIKMHASSRMKKGGIHFTALTASDPKIPGKKGDRKLLLLRCAVAATHEDAHQKVYGLAGIALS